MSNTWIRPARESETYNRSSSAERMSTVGSREAVGGEVHVPRRGVDPVHVARADLGLGAMALVVADDAEVRVGEPDRAVGTYDGVVRAVEPQAGVPVGEDGHAPVGLGAGDPPVALLAADQTALRRGVAVDVSGRGAEDTDAAGGLVPAQEAVVRDVAPDQLPPGGQVQRALGPAAAVVQHLQPAVPVHAVSGAEAVVQDFVQAVGRHGVLSEGLTRKSFHPVARVTRQGVYSRCRMRAAVPAPTVVT